MAILKVNYDQRGSDYISNFVPFVAEALRLSDSDLVSLADVQARVREAFGLNIPREALKTILARAVKAGFAKKEKHVYVRNVASLSELELAPIRQDAVRQYQAVLSRVTQYARDQRYEVSVNDMDDALARALTRRSVPILRLRVQGRRLVELPDNERNGPVDFILDGFIATAAARDPETLGFLETLAKGSMLAAAMYLPNPNEAARALGSLQVYLDTTFILRCLGLAGPELEVAARELLDLMRQLGAHLCCFRHTLAEINYVLHRDAIKLKLPRRLEAEEGYRETTPYLVATGKSSSDLEEVIAELPRRLAHLGIVVRERPGHVRMLTVDEPALEGLLSKEVHYRHHESLLRDLDSLTAIFRLRKGQSKFRLEDSTALFVTTNVDLSRVANEFFKTELTPGNFPLVLLPQTLTTLAWLKRPTSIPDLPIRQVIADCYAALSPSDELWNAYLTKITELYDRNEIDEAAYYNLMFSLQARQLLMTETENELQGFTDGTIQEVMQRFNAALLAEAHTETRAERDARLQAEALAVAADDRARESNDQRAAQARELKQRIFLAADWLGSATVIALFLLVSVAVSVMAPITNKPGSPISGPFLLATLLYLLLNIVAFLLGWDAWSLMKRLKPRIVSFYERRLRHRFMP
jgi:hypothetical protein